MRAVAVFLLLALAACSQPDDTAVNAPPVVASAVLPEGPRIVRIDAADLQSAFATDAAAAGRYHGARVMIRGTVLRIGYADAQMTEVVLAGSQGKPAVSLLSTSDEAANAAVLKPGQPIAVSCTDVEGPADDVTARDCMGFD